MTIPVFDGHNDILLRLLRAPERREAIWLTGEGRGHLDLPRMKAGGFAGGFFAVWVPSPADQGGLDIDRLMDNPPYALDLPGLIATRPAQAVAMAEIGHLLWMERASGGAFGIVRSAAEIRDNLASGTISAILHMEGAEPISEGLDELYLYHAAGLRSLGPVWSRPNVFGSGVPFAWPASPDCGPGLTGAGRDLVRECNRLGIALDLAHITEAGFWDAASLTDAPLIVSHSNAHALTAVARNLTDRQMDAVRERDGLVGLNFACTMLRPDGQEDAATPLSDMVRHIDHMVARMGIGCVALGSDFDGALIPEEIGDAAGTQALVRALGAAGYGPAELRRLCRENWLRVLGAAWQDSPSLPTDTDRGLT